MNLLSQILWRNQGQVLTPELISGILHGADYTPDNSIDVGQFAPCEYNGYTFAVERYQDIVDEIKPLHKLHWEEVDERLAVLPLNPDYPRYVKINREGRSLKFTVRKNGELVGYCLVMLSKSLHTQTNYAYEDALFMRKDHRGGFTIIQFVKYMVRCLAGIGVREIRVTSKTSNKAHLLMQRAGFTPCAIQLVLMTEANHADQA